MEGKPHSYREQDEEDRIWFRMVDDSKRSDTLETEEPVGGFEINSTERCCSKGPGRSKEQRVRRWQRPREETVSVRTREGARVQGEISSRGAAHSSSATVEMNAQTKKRQTVISTEQTEVRIVVPPEVPHDTRICVEDLVDKEINQLREEKRSARRECRHQTWRTCTQRHKQIERADEIICRLGQRGIQVGNACWKLFCHRTGNAAG